jgi:hypothetical protein
MSDEVQQWYERNFVGNCATCGGKLEGQTLFKRGELEPPIMLCKMCKVAEIDEVIDRYTKLIWSYNLAVRDLNRRKEQVSKL